MDKQKYERCTPHRDEVFKNEYRSFFALNKVEMQWNQVYLNQSTSVYFDGDIIVKVIENKLVVCEDGTLFGSYIEFDTFDNTESRSFILPKTNRGKKKKITPSSVMSILPQGCSFYFFISDEDSSNRIVLLNNRNNQEIRITGFDSVRTANQLHSFFEDYVKTCPNDYFEKIDRLRNAKHVTIKYRTGDIFRFDLDRSHYGYGLIIASISKLEKDKLIYPPHGLCTLMGQGLIIRLYKISTEDPNLKSENLRSIDLLPADAMMDNTIIWNRHPIVDHKKLEENDVDFPFQLSKTTSGNIVLDRFISWGIGIKKSDQHSFPTNTKFSWKSNLAISQIIPYYLLEKALQGCSGTSVYSDLRHPDNIEQYHAVLEYFGLDPEISFDEFNRSCGGMTRKQYADYINFPKDQN